LEEVYLQLGYPPGQLDALKIIDLLGYVKEMGFQNIELSTALGHIALATVQGSPQTEVVSRFRCWNTDRTKLIQLSPDLIVVNQLGKYLGWDQFVQLINLPMKFVDQKFKNLRPHVLNFTARDKLKVQKEGFKFSKYFNCDGSIIPRSFEDLKESADLTLGRGFIEQQGHNKVVKISVRELEKSFEVTITTVCGLKITEENGFEGSLNIMYNEFNRAFEQVITDFTRKVVMEGLI